VASTEAIFRQFFSSRLRPMLLLAAIAIAVYGNTLSHGYVLDDYVTVEHNELVAKGFSALSEIFSTPYQYGFSLLAKNQLYRPLSIALFATEREFFGESPFAGHLINVLLFAACVVLLFRFLDRLFTERRAAAFLATLLFALHPIHTEVVANIKSCDELLCFLFAFLSLNLLLTYARNGKVYGLLCGILCLFLALLSKETAITLAAVIPLIFFFYSNEHRKRSVFVTMASLVTTAIYLAVRAAVFRAYDIESGQVSMLDNILVSAPSAASRIATAVLILGHYLRLLFVPYPLYYDYSYNAIPFAGPGDAGVIISGVLYAALLCIGIFRLMKHRKDPLAFGILFFLITISVFSNLFVTIGANMAERFLFFPSVGFCVAVGFVADHWQANKTRWLLLALVLLVFTWITISRNADWKDNLTLYRADSEKSSGSWRIYYNLGVVLTHDIIGKRPDAAQMQQVAEGIRNFQRSVAIYPGYDVAQEHLGTAFLAIGKMDSAIVHFREALRINPRNGEALKRLTGMYFYNKQFRQALEMYRYALTIDPNARVQGYIGVCYLNLAKYDSAIAVFNNVLAAEPRNMSVIKGLADAYAQLGKADSAVKYQALLQKR
jgi:hypothetical protein